MERNWYGEIERQLAESAEVKRRISQGTIECLLKAAQTVADSLKSGGKVLMCGNGGSAADCQHIAAELVGRLAPGRERIPFSAIALTTNTSCLTALGNDRGFEHIFSRQVEALGTRGDILIAISTSGNSKNILLAVQRAKEKDLKTIGFTGGNGGRLKELVDLAIVMPSDETPRIQEAHITIGHILCDLVEQMLCAP